jgi:hypothetical protein
MTAVSNTEGFNADEHRLGLVLALIRKLVVDGAMAISLGDWKDKSIDQRAPGTLLIEG